MPSASARAPGRSAGGRWATATVSRTSGSAAAHAARRPRSPAGPRDGRSGHGRRRAIAAGERRAAPPARALPLRQPGSAAEGARRHRSTGPGRSGSEPAQTRAAAAALEPLASPTAVARITRPFIGRPACEGGARHRQAIRHAPASGEGGRRRTVTSPPCTAVLDPPSAQPGKAPRRGPAPAVPRPVPVRPPRRHHRPGSGRTRRGAAAGPIRAGEQEKRARGNRSTVACPCSLPIRQLRSRPAESAAAGRAGGAGSPPAPQRPRFADPRARAQRRRQRLPCRRRRIAADQRSSRPRPRRDPGRPQRLSGEADLCRHQHRQQQERDDRDQLDRGGPLLPVACAAGDRWRHTATVAATSACVARSGARTQSRPLLQ